MYGPAIPVTQEAEAGRSQRLTRATGRIKVQYIQFSKILTQNKHCEKGLRIYLSGTALASVCETLYAIPNTAGRRDGGRDGGKEKSGFSSSTYLFV